MNAEIPKFVIIGGGKGPSAVRRGLKELPIHITSIVPSADSGGSTGKLRRDYDVLSMGDLTQAWGDHAIDPDDGEFLHFRFPKGEGINGHRNSNLGFLVAMEVFRDKALKENWPVDQINNDHLVAKVLDYHRRKYPITGNVVPSTAENNLDLITILTDGTRLAQEHLLDFRDGGVPISKVELSKEAIIYPEAKIELEGTDACIYGSSSLRGSIEAVLAVQGVPEAIRRGRSLQIMVQNIANWKGDTAGFKTSDYARVITDWTGIPIDYLVYFKDSQTNIDPEIIKDYEKEGQEIVELDDKTLLYVRQVRCFDLIKVVEEGNNGERKFVLRHDPQKVGRALMSVWEEHLAKIDLSRLRITPSEIYS